MAAQNKDNRAVILEEALTRFVDECLQGSKPDIDEFAGQYPQCEAQLKRRIRDLKEIDFLFDSLIRADEVEFGATTAPQDLVGHKLASFDVERVIGQGGMGVVYLARDTKLDRHVAIKSMPAGLLSSSKAQARFKSEAKLLASLNHPNIAVIYDIIEEQEGVSYLVLEYVPGETLAERIARKPLELEDALAIGGQIADAVAAAHKKDIIHRDLKPSNIKITPEGRVKVLDFGLAKTYDRNSKGSETAAIQPGRVIGTPAYMSPEQAQGKDTDRRTDIWSFGCIMFEMLTGRHPFECDTAKDTMESIIKSQPDWNLLPESTPSNIRTLLRRCLEKNPNQRLGDISDAAFEISTTLSTQPIPLPVRLRRMSLIIFATIAVTLTGVATWFALTSSKEISLLVLPFENSGSAEDADLANSIMDEIKARLAGINGFRAYKSREKGAKSMAIELGFNYILEGTLQREKQSDPNSLVRINPRLIRASDGSLVWEQPFIHVGDVFQTSSDLTRKVAEVLDITLLETEQQLLTSMPTENKDAYNYYVRGIQYSSRPYQTKDNVVIAIEMYERAVGLDENFALAYARLSEAHSGMYWFSHDRSEERLMMACEASEKALKLNPKLPEAHWARGVYYYWGRSDHVRALDELGIALKSQPDNSQVLRFIAFVKRQQGKYEEALVYLREAFKLDPLSSSLAMAIGNTLKKMGKYPEAEPYYEQAILLAPDEFTPYRYKVELYLALGDTKNARETLERASKYINLADEWRAVVWLFELDVLDTKYEEALAQLPLTDELTSLDVLLDALRYAQIYGYIRDRESEKKFYDKARIILEAKVEEEPNNAFFHAKLGVAFASLGRKEDAIQSGKKGLELLRNHNTARDMAHIYMMVGEFDAAVDQIEYMLTIPGGLSIPLLKIDPLWDTLRNHPGFKKLIEQGN